ncbi:MAG: band 7/Mec-2 family protein [Opitutaceae bacterium]|nr:band 7/Mec-2 family protein [Opitutaceae bacterium]|tara:strand:+ start:1793 stop:2623 length:831 start_codon:yes stop_codon:yes gene_type:complete
MITTIPQNHCRIIERFGKPVKVQKSGIAIKIPILDSVKDVSSEWGNETNKKGVFIELSEQITDTNPRECITSDNAKVLIDSVISWRVIDPIKAVYEVDHLHQSLLQATLNIIRSEIGGHELDYALQARTTLNEKISARLTDTVAKWGLQLIRVEIQEIKTDDATGAAMLQQMDAERKSRAAKLEAEGQAKATIEIAKADREAAILRAEGQAKALEITAAAEKFYLDTLGSAIGSDDANRILLAQKVIDGYSIISKNPGNKVFIPSNVQSFIELGKS